MSNAFGSFRHGRALLLLGCVVALGVTGCKKTETKDSQKTLDELKAAKDQLTAQNEYIQKLRDQNASYERDGVTPSGDGGGEWVFTIEGDALVIKAKPGGGGGGGGSERDVDDATATKLATQFLGVVEKSRGSIQKCYEQALKKSSGLAASTVNLRLSASFAASGKFTKVTFKPDNLPDIFNSCLRTVAGRWNMAGVPQAMTFAANVKLTPT